MTKKDEEENKKENLEEEKEDEISNDWFRDHEPYDEEESDEEEVFSEDELEDTNFEEEDFSSRVKHFLANQRKDVSLETMLEVPKSTLEESLPKRKEENKKEEDSIDYLTGNKLEGMKYQSFEPETKFSRPDMSSGERILEEQKALYSHLKNAGGEMIGNNKNDWNPVTPENIKKKNYLTGKKFTTGPY